MNTTKTSRRDFLKTSTFASAGALALSRSSYASVIGANDRIRFGVIGCGGMGTGHLGSLVKQEDFKAKNDDKEEVRLPLKQRRDLEGNFIDVLRGKDKLACNADLGCATMVAIKMAVESFRQKKTMLWDARHEKVVTA